VARRRRAALLVAGAAVVVLGTRLVAAPPPAASLAAPVPAADVVLLGDQADYTTTPGQATLRLQFRNSSSSEVLLRAASIPQSGVGAATLHDALLPGQATGVAVSLAVHCPAALRDPPARVLHLTGTSAGGPIRVTVDLALLGNLWDDARYDACGERSPGGALLVAVPAESLHVAGRTIRAELAVTTAASQPVTAKVTDAGVAGLVLTGPVAAAHLPPAPTPTRLLPVDWTVLSCARAAVPQWPLVALTVSVPGSTSVITYGLDPTFGAAWRAALRHACR